MSKSKSWIVVVGIVVAMSAASWWMGRRSAGTVPGLGISSDAPAGETQALQDRIRQLEQETATLRDHIKAQGLEPVKAPAAGSTHKAPEETTHLDTVRLLSQVQAKLNAANTSIAELQNRTQELEASLEKVTADNKRSLSEEGELRESLASMRRLAQALEAEAKTKNDRISQLESAVARGKDENAASQRQATQLAALLKEFEEINRRRENYLTSLQRRYRDLTDQYRALALRLDTQRDNPVAFAPDISRIQGAVQLAEDDLRQLGALNTQAQRLSQRLGK